VPVPGATTGAAGCSVYVADATTLGARSGTHARAFSVVVPMISTSPVAGTSGSLSVGSTPVVV